MPKLTYFKRHRMELDLRHPRPDPGLPSGFHWLPWTAELLDLHARVMSNCFAGETDADVFPSLGSLDGCRDLMRVIAGRPGFCPGATWLVIGPDGDVGTVQGVIDSNTYGSIQNLGVLAGYRGLGIGRALLLKALAGFAAAGVRQALLEVTTVNEPAVRMYRRFGFRACKTIYRGVEVRPRTPDPLGVGI